MFKMCVVVHFTCSLMFWSGWRCRGVVIPVDGPSPQSYRSYLNPHGFAMRQQSSFSSVMAKYIISNNLSKVLESKNINYTIAIRPVHT